MKKEAANNIKWILLGTIIGAVITPIISGLVRTVFRKVGMKLEGPKYPLRRL